MSNRNFDMRNDLFDELFSYMTVEIGLFSQFSTMITELSISVRKKNWPSLELIVVKLNQIGDEIVAVEKKRNSLFSDVKKNIDASEETRLSDLLPLIDIHKRTELSKLTNRLKEEVLKVKVTSRGLDYFLQSVSHLLKNIFEEMFPHTRGKIYSRSGKENVTNDGVIMINTKL